MIFSDKDKKISSKEVAGVEERLGIKFPAPLREFYLESNGGCPEAFYFCSDEHDLYLIVNETLPLISETGRGTAVSTYTRLVEQKRLVPKNFFPLAVDPGGEYFFVDCNSPGANVYYFDSRDWSGDTDNCLIDFSLPLDDFWAALSEDED